MIRNMAKVVYNYLGGSGLKVSNICLGTMTFGEHPGGRPSCTEKESHAILDKYAELGGNFIDTADVYQMGLSETIVGNWLTSQQRDKFVIATKCRRNMDPSNPNANGASRKHIMAAIDASLKRLKTDYVDIYYIHLWDKGTPIEETLSALNDLVRQGKVRYLAMSNVKGWQMQKIVDTSKQRNWENFVCLQNQYNLLTRGCELEVTEVCQNEGIGFVPWSPLKGGWLSGKLKRGVTVPEEGTRVSWASEKQGRAIHSHPNFDWFASSEQAWNVIDKCAEIGKSHGKSVAQVAIRWVLQKPNIPSVIIGVSKMEQLLSSMDAGSGWSLSEQQMIELDAVSDVPSPYPYDYVERDNADRARP